MWNGKKKAVTFSFDDGVTQDIRLIEIFNKYGLKCTFNLNSGFLGLDGTLDRNGHTVRHDKIAREKIKDVYKDHEVAVHTLTHPFLPSLDEAEIIRQVENDRLALSEICGYDVVSMAYPCGGNNNDDRVAEIIKNNTGVRFARGIESSYSFDLQENLLRFKPTVYYIENCLDEIVEKFLALETDSPALLYIWGHSYEMDAEYISWEKFEEVCKKLSGRDDIFYGTNKEVFMEYGLHKQYKKELTLAKENDEFKVDAFITCQNEDVNFDGGDKIEVPSVSVCIKYGEKEFWGHGKDYLWTDAFAQLQKQLPDGVKIHCCMTCRHGNMCPVGNEPGELFCTKDVSITQKSDLFFYTENERAKRSRNCTDVCESYQEQTSEHYTYNDYLHR